MKKNPIIIPYCKMDATKVREGLLAFVFDSREIFPSSSDFDDLESIRIGREIERISKIDVPNGFEDKVGKFLKRFSNCYGDRLINYYQFTELVKEFAYQLANDVPRKEKIFEICREAYNETIWKIFIDEKITLFQFAKLMKKNIRVFKRK